jgi:hypothetical protein
MNEDLDYTALRQLALEFSATYSSDLTQLIKNAEIVFQFLIKDKIIN